MKLNYPILMHTMVNKMIGIIYEANFPRLPLDLSLHVSDPLHMWGAFIYYTLQFAITKDKSSSIDEPSKESHENFAV